MPKRIIHGLVALISATAAVPGFAGGLVYTYQTVFDANADTYIVDQQNVKKYSEWQVQPVTYWGPSANDVNASLTMRFSFSAPTAQASLNAELTAANWINGGRSDYGSSSLWGSTDGVTWQQLAIAEVATGAPFIGTNVVYGQNLPGSLLGGTQLWLQVRMFTHDSLVSAYPDPAASWADAQFSRYDPNTPPVPANVFELNVITVPEPSSIALAVLALLGFGWRVKKG